MKQEYSYYLICELYKIQSIIMTDYPITQWKVSHLNLRINNILMGIDKSSNLSDDYNPYNEFLDLPEASHLLSYKKWQIKRRNGRIKDVLSPRKG